MLQVKELTQLFTCNTDKFGTFLKKKCTKHLLKKKCRIMKTQSITVMHFAKYLTSTAGQRAPGSLDSQVTFNVLPYVCCKTT